MENRALKDSNNVLAGFIQCGRLAPRFITGRPRISIPYYLLPTTYSLILAIFYLLSSIFFLTTPPAHAGGSHPVDELIKGVEFEQKLNQQLPLELTFQDEAGQPVQLADYFGRKPVILVFAYYECPMLCTLVLNGLLATLNNLTFDIGDEFEVITVSIDPTETPELAAAKKEIYLEQYRRPAAGAGWHFLVGQEAAIGKLTQAAGFHYQYDSAKQEYAHPTGIMVVTPEGKIARYFYGIDFPARDVRLGLVEAAANKIGSPVDQLLLLCYHYDPVVGQYTVTIMNVIRAAGLTTVAAIGAVVTVLLRRERGRKLGESLSKA
ncbi:MAG: SCO family protein [Anaerolineae bacterium]|nr:SCO family protein [Anaerolineales bacterium]MCQ3978602.1 SCO family protein [Anaerolineae bacterium]